MAGFSASALMDGEGFAGLAKAVGRAEEKRESEEKKAASARVELSRIATLILQMDARAIHEDPEKEKEARRVGRSRLAASLGSTVEDLQEIVESYGEKWDELLLEERVRHGIDSTTIRDITWDRLEASVLRKLLSLVDSNLVRTVPELLAIAKTANGAARGERGRSGNQGQGQGQGGAGGGNQLNVFMPGAPGDGVLPSGNLGKITLNLSPRVIKQIEGKVEQEERLSLDPFATPAPEHERELDSITMLTLDEIQAADEAREEGEEK